MHAVIEAPPSATSAPATAEAVTPTLRQGLRRHRAWIAIAVVLVIGALVVLVVQGGAQPPGPALGAANAAPTGSKALVQVLRANGVDVTEVRSAGAAVEAAHAGATVFLYDEAAILDDDRLEELADAADRLVVAEPAFGALEVLAPGVRLAGAASGPIDDVACTAGPAERAGELSEGQRLLTIDDAAAAVGWDGCFRDGDFGYAVATGPGPVGRRRRARRRHDRVRERARRRGRQRRARVGLLGASDELVWYLPGPADADADAAPTIAELTPGWVSPVLVLAIVVIIAAGVWRGRRLRAARRREPARARPRRRDERGTGPPVRAQRRAQSRTRPAAHRRDRAHRRRRCGFRAPPRSTRSRMPPRSPPVAIRGIRCAGSWPTPRRQATATSSTSRRISTARTRGGRLRATRPRRPHRPDRKATMTDAIATTDEELRAALNRVRTEVGKAVVGQDGAVTGLIIALLTRGHVLLEGVPGVAKTLLVRTLSRTLRLDTRAAPVHARPDAGRRHRLARLRPARRASSRSARDRCSRTSCSPTRSTARRRRPSRRCSRRWRSARSRADGVTRPLPDPFMVAATQNPIEYEGTYALPEAQLDRFLLKLVLDIPERDAEVTLLRRHADGFDPHDLAAAGVTPVLGAAELAAPRSGRGVGARRGRCARLRRRPRPRHPAQPLDAARREPARRPPPCSPPRRRGRGSPATTRSPPTTCRPCSLPVWRHRVQLRPEAELEGVSVDAVLRSIVQQVQVPL